MSKSSTIVTGEVNNRRWVHLPDDTYLVTGVDRSGRRFSNSYSNWFWAKAINLWHGSRWLVRDGKRTLLTRC